MPDRESAFDSAVVGWSICDPNKLRLKIAQCETLAKTDEDQNTLAEMRRALGGETT